MPCTSFTELEWTYPEQFAALSIVYAVAGVGMILCVLLNLVWCHHLLSTVYGVMRQRESLTRIKARDEAIEMEMPHHLPHLA